MYMYIHLHVYEASMWELFDASVLIVRVFVTALQCYQGCGNSCVYRFSHVHDAYIQCMWCDSTEIAHKQRVRF